MEKEGAPDAKGKEYLDERNTVKFYPINGVGIYSLMNIAAFVT
jgi:hypothetical protein